MSNICWTILTMKWKRREQMEILKRSDKIIDTAQSSSEARNCHECRCQRSVSFTGRSGEMRAEIRRYQERCCVIHEKRWGVRKSWREIEFSNVDSKWFCGKENRKTWLSSDQKSKTPDHVDEEGEKWWSIAVTANGGEAWPSWPPSSSRVCMIPIIMHGTKYLIFYI